MSELYSLFLSKDFVFHFVHRSSNKVVHALAHYAFICFRLGNRKPDITYSQIDFYLSLVMIFVEFLFPKKIS